MTLSLTMKTPSNSILTFSILTLSSTLTPALEERTTFEAVSKHGRRIITVLLPTSTGPLNLGPTLPKPTMTGAGSNDSKETMTVPVKIGKWPDDIAAAGSSNNLSGAYCQPVLLEAR